MTTQQITRTVIEQTTVSEHASEMLRRDGNGDFEVVVEVAMSKNGREDKPATFRIRNDKLVDDGLILTAAELTAYLQYSKKLYDYARNNIEGSTP